MSKQERFLFVVQKGHLAPADEATKERLRDKGYKLGDVLSATLSKPRNPQFHRLAHALGKLIAQNIDSFNGMEAHKVLKRLQWESGFGCTEIGVMVPGVGFATTRWPDSLSFANMDEGEFHEIMRGLCRHIAATYWPGMSVERINAMAELMVNE